AVRLASRPNFARKIAGRLLEIKQVHVRVALDDVEAEASCDRTYVLVSVGSHVPGKPATRPNHVADGNWEDNEDIPGGGAHGANGYHERLRCRKRGPVAPASM